MYTDLGLDTPRKIRRRLVVTVAAVVSLLAVAACDANTTTRQDTQPGVIILDPTTVEDLLSAISSAGLPAPNPRDVTSRDCPQLGCTKKVETDTVSIIKFPTPGTAEVYAGWTRDRFQVADVVVSFSPSMPADQRTAYEDAVTQAIA